jgi:teichuronic acid exporter
LIYQIDILRRHGGERVVWYLLEMIEEIANAKEKSLLAVKWTYLQSLLPRLISPIVIIVLARLLTPADFGMVAVATTTLSLLQIFQDMGLSKALIQSNEGEEAVFSVVFWTNLALSLVLFSTLFFFARTVAAFFKNPEAVPIIRSLGVVLILDALGAVQRNALIRRIEFKRLFIIGTAPALLPLFVTVPLAYVGWGVWALVAGNLAATGLSTVLLWFAVTWRPTATFNAQAARRVFIFGLWATVEAFVGWFYVQGDNAIVGRFFSAKEFGMYVVGYNVATMTIGIMLTPVSSIAFTLFSKMQKHTAALRSTLLDTTTFCALISLPAGVGIYFVAEPATQAIFGKGWVGMEFILGILALAQGLSWIVTSHADAYRATGRQDTVSKFQLAKLLYTAPAYIIFAYMGFRAFVYGKLCVTVLGVFLWFLLAGKTFSITFRNVIDHLRVPVLATAGMALSVLLVDHFLCSVDLEMVLMRLFMLIATGAVSYIVLLYYLDADLMKRVRSLAYQSAGFKT